MSAIKEYVISWFIENSICTEVEVSEHLESNYFEMGWIDSLQFIQFVTDLESKFSITFDNSEFQDRAFATISGLCDIILQKQDA